MFFLSWLVILWVLDFLEDLFFCPGFGRGISILCLIYFGCFPAFAVLFRISAMPSFTSFGPHFSCSAVMSIPALLLFFSDFMALLTSPVKGCFISLVVFEGNCFDFPH